MKNTSGVRITALLAVAASAIALSACSSSGGSGNSNGASSSTSASTASSPATSSSSSASSSSSSVALPSSLAGKSSINIAAVPDYPPLSYAEGSKIVGFNVDLLNAVAGVLGTKFNYVNTSFDDLIPSIKSGRVVIAEGGTTDTTEGEGQTTMVDYMAVGTQFIVPKGNPKNFSGPDSFCGAKVAVLAGASDYIATLNQLSDQCKKDGKSGISQSVFQTADQALLAMTAGRVDAEFDANVLQSYRISQGVKVETVGGVLQKSPIAIQVPTDQQDLATALKNALDVLIKNGQYDSLLKKWNLQGSGLSAAAINNPKAS